MPGIGRPGDRIALLVVEHGAGEERGHHAEHDGQSGALVALHRGERAALAHVVRVGGRLAVLVQGPALGDRLAAPAVDVEPVAGDDAQRHVDEHRLVVRTAGAFFGSDHLRGTAQDGGLLPTIASLPPTGAIVGPALVNEKPIMLWRTGTLAQKPGVAVVVAVAHHDGAGAVLLGQLDRLADAVVRRDVPEGAIGTEHSNTV